MLNNFRTSAICKILLFAVSAILFRIDSPARAQEIQFIYDGRNEPPVASASSTDVQKIRRFALPNARRFWRNEDCQEALQVVGAANGSFTKPNTNQRAVLYRFCVTGHDFANNGIAIFEAGALVVHVTIKGGEDRYIGALGDITGDGLQEILLADTSMHQGYSNSLIRLIAFSSAGIRKFGIADAYEDDCGAVEKGCTVKAYRISAKSSQTPIFYRDVFTRKSGAWVKVRTRTAFSLRNDEGEYHLLK